MAELDGHAVAQCYVPPGTEVAVSLEEKVVIIRRAGDGHVLATGLTPI